MAKKDLNKVKNTSPEHTGETGKEKIEDTTKKEVANELNVKIKEVLSELLPTHTVEEKEMNGLSIYHMTNTLSEKKDEPEISVVVNQKGEVKIKVRPYDHYEEFYFVAEGLNGEDTANEMKKLNECIKTGELVEGSKMKKINNPNGNDYLLNPENANKFDASEGEFSQAEYERLYTQEGPAAAAKYSDNIRLKNKQTK